MSRLLINLFILFFTGCLYAADDLAVSSIRVTYKDNVTNPDEVVIRELKSLQDDSFWSKPDHIDVAVEIKNPGKQEYEYVNLSVELYYLLSPRESRFPAMQDELKSLTNKPVWVWKSTLATDTVRELGPGSIMTHVFNNLDISNQYYATDYQFEAFAIRVFASPRHGKDPDFNNNVKQWLVSYGD